VIFTQEKGYSHRRRDIHTGEGIFTQEKGYSHKRRDNHTLEVIFMHKEYSHGGGVMLIHKKGYSHLKGAFQKRYSFLGDDILKN